MIFLFLAREIGNLFLLLYCLSVHFNEKFQYFQLHVIRYVSLSKYMICKVMYHQSRTQLRLATHWHLEFLQHRYFSPTGIVYNFPSKQHGIVGWFSNPFLTINWGILLCSACSPGNKMVKRITKEIIISNYIDRNWKATVNWMFIWISKQ